MTKSSEAPWFDALSGDDAAQYLTRGEELVSDLRTAALFMNDIDNMRAFPVRSYQPDVDLQYFVNEADDDPKGDFERLAANIVAAGGSTFDRSDVERGTVQHIAELRFGSGRVAYRAVWIERLPTDG